MIINMYVYYSTVIIVRVPSIKIPVFIAQHRLEKEIGTAYRIIILLSLILLYFAIYKQLNLYVPILTQIRVN